MIDTECLQIGGKCTDAPPLNSLLVKHLRTRALYLSKYINGYFKAQLFKKLIIATTRYAFTVFGKTIN